MDERAASSVVPIIHFGRENGEILPGDEVCHGLPDKRCGRSRAGANLGLLGNWRRAGEARGRPADSKWHHRIRVDK